MARRILRQEVLPSYQRGGLVRTKASATGPLLVTGIAHTPVFTPRRYERLADEAYCKNVIANMCVRLIADAVASLKLMVFKNGVEIEDPQHPLKQLLKRQNPLTTGGRWWQELVSYHLLAGNAYIESVGPSDSAPPKELWNLRPDRMKIIPGDMGMPESYRYELNGQYKDFEVDFVTGAKQLLHIRSFHPLNDWYGMSPVEAGARYIDMDNAASDHNLAQLQNGANPSGLIVFKEKMEPKSAAAWEAKIQEKLSGPGNAGRIKVVGGGDWTFQRIGDTAVDMQWLEGMDQSARRVCAAWNVPHILIVAGESTYNNRESARVELWLHTVLPYFDMVLGDINPWLQTKYEDEELEIRYDRASIEALEPVRQKVREQARADWQAGAITLNEFRAEIDYGEVPDGDRLEPMVANDPAQANAKQAHDLSEEAADNAHERGEKAADNASVRKLKEGEVENQRSRIDATTAHERATKDGDVAHRRAIELADRKERQSIRRKDDEDDDEHKKGGSNGGWRKVRRNRDGKWQLGGGTGDKPAAGGKDPKLTTKPTGGLSPAQRAAATRRANAEARLQGGAAAAAKPAADGKKPAAEGGQKPLTPAQRAWLTRKAKQQEQAAAATAAKPTPAKPTAAKEPAAGGQLSPAQRAAATRKARAEAAAAEVKEQLAKQKAGQEPGAAKWAKADVEINGDDDYYTHKGMDKALRAWDKTDGFDDSTLGALNHYRDVSWDINTALRQKDGWPDRPTEQIAEQIDAILQDSRTTKSIRVYRGAPVGDLKIGDSFVDEGFVSTSFSREVAGSFATRRESDGKAGAVLEMFVPKGTKSIAMDNYLDDEMYGYREAEVLLGRGHKMTVVGQRKDQGQTIYQVVVSGGH